MAAFSSVLLRRAPSWWAGEIREVGGRGTVREELEQGVDDLLRLPVRPGRLGAVHHSGDVPLLGGHPPRGLPPGQVFHAAGPSEGGWTICAIHDSPKMAAGIPGGFTAPLQESTFEVDTQPSA